MLETEFHISKLIAEHFKGEIDMKQTEELNKWLSASEANQTCFNAFNDEARTAAAISDYESCDIDAIWELTIRKMEAGKAIISREPVKRSKIYQYLSIAAMFFVLLGAGFYFYNFKEMKSNSRFTKDIMPGKNSATLILSNGKRIVLSDASNGELANEGGVSISKTSTGALIYKIKSSGGTTKLMNTLSTTNGETYQVVLPDNSKVWLNAASSIKYPSNFESLKERKIELTGEAYFEVSKDKQHPFIVKTMGQEVAVRGTHFNVNAYEDDGNTRTVLLEGSVVVSSGTGSIGSTVLKPGQQSILNGKVIRVEHADVELAVAWKNNKFMFEGEKIENIMKMIARWYNVEVVYQGSVPDDLFGGSVSRFDKVSKVLNVLELTGNVHFKIEGRRITVMN
jgi:transmembrane sensor